MEESTIHHQQDNKSNSENPSNATSTSTPSQTLHQTVDYGILGISDDEDSAKWAQDEMIKAAANKVKNQSKEITQNVGTEANALRIISSKNQPPNVDNPVKIILTNTGGNIPDALTQAKSLNQRGKAQDNATLADNLKPKKTNAEPIPKNATIGTSSSNVHMTGKHDTAYNQTAIKSNAVQGVGTKPQNETTPDNRVHQVDLEAKQNNTLANVTTHSTTAQGVETSTQSDPVPGNALHQTHSEAKQNNAAGKAPTHSTAAQGVETSTQSDPVPGNALHQTHSEAKQNNAAGKATTHSTAAQGVGANTQNVSVSNTSVHHTNSESRANHAPGNATSTQELNTKLSNLKATGSVGLSPKLNQSQNNEQFASYPKSPSLEVNITSLRNGQSFDFQMPSTIPSKSSFQDNHIHLEPNDVLKPSGYSPKDIESNSSNSDFLNVALNKVEAEEQEKGEKPNKLLQKLNSDILASRAEPLTSNVNSGGEVTDETFREESPAGRTFSENLLEPYSNEGLLTRRPNTLQAREGQAEVQQDESLANALNSSSVSSVIFSANRAIFDTDKEVFSKKSAQGRLNLKDKDQRQKRSNLLHSLTKHHRKNRLASNYPRRTQTLGKHKAQRRVTARQVINLGNHFLWFGGQSSADANGFPRHNTETANNAYNVNGYMSNFLNTASSNEAPSATKGYKALQSALSSMESSQDGQAEPYILDPTYAVPSNKEWQAADHGQTPANVVIQDDTGKPVYQGTVDIFKFNDTKTHDSANSEPGNQNNVLKAQKHESPNKENGTGHVQTEHDFFQNANSGNENGTSGIANSSNPITAYQDSINDGNQTVIRNAAGSIGHVDGKNSTASSEDSFDQTDIQKTKGMKLSEQNHITVHSERHNSPKLSNKTAESEESITQQPSAIIKKITANIQEPETYHVIVNDAGKKITNANGHVTVIISGPTATQASMPDENTLLIPQTNRSELLPGNDYLSTNDRGSKTITHLAIQTANSSSLNEYKINGTSGNKQISPLSLLQEDSMPALKISEEIEGQIKKGQADSVLSTSQDQMHQLSKQDTDAHASVNQNKNLTTENPEELMQNSHHFVKIGQDLTGNIGDLQMEEVSLPNLQAAQQKEQDKLAAESTGGILLGGDQLAAQQSQDVPTLNIVLNPMQRIDGSLSVGGKIIPIGSAKEGDSRQLSAANEQRQEKLDCHADPKNEKARTTILTCQKKHGLANIPQSFQGDVYYGNVRTTGGPALQLDQVMNVLNDQVKATINKEMKTESKDIENVLKDMTMPSSTLMDTEEAYSQAQPPEHSSLMDTEETFTSRPDFERQNTWKNRHRYHRKMQPFGFPHRFGFSHRFGFPHRHGFHHHLGFPNRRQFWGYNRHSNPFVVMAHKDSDEGFWDYQHNIFIPRRFSHDNDHDDDDDDREEYNRAKHWVPWSHHGHRRGNWAMAHPPLHPHHQTFSPFMMPFREHDPAHFRLPTIYGRSGPWRPLHPSMAAPQAHKQEQGTKRTAVVHKTIRGDRDLCRPVIGGPSPPLKSEWEYLGKVLSSCPCRLTDSEW